MGLIFLVTGFFEFERFWINRRFGQGGHIPYVGPRGLDDTSTIEPKQTKKSLKVRQLCMIGRMGYVHLYVE